MRIGSHAPTNPPLSLEAFFARLRNRVRIAVKDRADAQEQTVSEAQKIAERRHQLVDFYGVYEELVETLCDAAQYGPSGSLEKRYARARGWLTENYAPVRRYLTAFLRYAAEDAESISGQGGSSADAFEALFSAPDLHTFLNADDGRMVSRLTRTREALNLYGDHLRQLAHASA